MMREPRADEPGWNMPAVLLVVSLFFTTGQEPIGATADEKTRFLELVEELAATKTSPQARSASVTSPTA